ncbi:MAG: MXAN_5187 C-terminal domain-containing protein [Acidobacteriota bacterium]
MNKLLDQRQTADQAANKKLERDIDQLAASIQRFRVDSQRFFAGDLPVPPEEQRERILAELRRLRGASLKGAAANFRLGSLEAQFQSHLDLFGRRLRARELGADGGARVTEKKDRYDATKGIVVGSKDRKEAVAALYEGLYRYNPKMDLERFRTYIDRQTEAIRAKTGCQEIQFRIAVQDGKTKLKAKPLRKST